MIILKETKNHRLYKLRQNESLQKVGEEEQKVVTKQEIKKQFTQNLRDLPIFKNNISHPNIYNLYQEA